MHSWHAVLIAARYVFERRLSVWILGIQIATTFLDQPLCNFEMPIVGRDVERRELACTALGLPRVLPVDIGTLSFEPVRPGKTTRWGKMSR